MRYIQSPSTDPYFNLALEQYVFDRLPETQSYFMLWQNENTVVIGKHQNTIEEINYKYVKEHQVRVARRLSGGGAVYHDLGNVNFTFIADYAGQEFDFQFFCRPILELLKALGIPAQLSGRNDMVIEGKKFSGNSQYIKNGRIMHHGTLMFDSNLEVLDKVLRVSQTKIRSKGLPSVRGRVTNIKPFLPRPMSTMEFLACVREFMRERYEFRPYILTEEDICHIEKLRDDVYARWEWNYGSSPAYQMEKKKRVEGCGEVKVYMDVENGAIQSVRFFGDYFSRRDTQELSARLTGVKLEEGALRQCVEETSIGDYFRGMTQDSFCELLLQN